MHPIQWLFLGEPPNVKPNIEFIYDAEEPKVQHVLAKLISAKNGNSDSEEEERPKLEYKRTMDNKDFFSLSTSILDSPESNNQQPLEEVVKSPAVKRQRRNSTVSLVKELLNLTLEEREKPKEKEKEEDTHTKHFKSLVIELEQDDEFFKMLLEELQQATLLQDQTNERFKQDISELESRMTKVVRVDKKIRERDVLFTVFFRLHRHKRQTCTIGERFFQSTWMHRFLKVVQNQTELSAP